MQPSIFTKIINREIPAEILMETDEFIAILDIHPIQIGHTLLIPKVQVDKFYDLEPEIYTKLFEKAKNLAKSLEEIYQSKRVGMIIEGFGVPHVHLHLIPINEGNSLDPNKTTSPSKEELEQEAIKIRKGLQPHKLVQPI